MCVVECMSTSTTYFAPVMLVATDGCWYTSILCYFMYSLFYGTFGYVASESLVVCCARVREVTLLTSCLEDSCRMETSSPSFVCVLFWLLFLCLIIRSFACSFVFATCS